MTPAAIEPATSRFVAQHLNHCATAAPGPLTVAAANAEGSAKGFLRFQYVPGSHRRLDTQQPEV